MNTPSEIDMDIKCTKCHDTKPLIEYYFYKGRRIKHCRSCIVKKAKAWKAANPERALENQRRGLKQWRMNNRERHLANCRRREKDPARKRRQIRNYYIRTYGIDDAVYDSMIKRSDGKCEICGRPERSNRRLAVDHVHGTTDVRGVLCGKCNMGIGKLGDNLESLKRAVAYLERFEATKSRKNSESWKVSNI